MWVFCGHFSLLDMYVWVMYVQVLRLGVDTNEIGHKQRE